MRAFFMASRITGCLKNSPLLIISSIRVESMCTMPRADVEVPDFAVAHLAFRQANKRAAGLNQGVGIFAQQAVVSRLAGEGDGVSFGFGAITPAVEDDEDEWFGTGQSNS